MFTSFSHGGMVTCFFPQWDELFLCLGNAVPVDLLAFLSSFFFSFFRAVFQRIQNNQHGFTKGKSSLSIT